MILRPITPQDVPVIHDFIVQLAKYERAADMVKMTEAQLQDALFGPKPRAEALIIESEEGEAGFAIWYESFNTWTGKPALHIEDVFINETSRGRGAGKLIFQHLANLALDRGCERMEWATLTWNEPAVRFYNGLGAEPLSEWMRYRLTGVKLLALAAGED